MERLLVNEDNLCITGDIHLGNPVFEGYNSFNSFLEYLCDNKFNLCINGDGLDILQFSFTQLSLELPSILERLELIVSKKLKVYYIAGNHDVYLENFFRKWKNLSVLPFLDIVSGDKRIHIEHGHLHDNFFLKFPSAYMRLGMLGGYFLRLSPSLYRLWDDSQKWIVKRLARKMDLPSVEKPEFIVAAEELIQRGYDVVILGHSHCVVQFTMEGGGQYFNTGSWLESPNHFVEVKEGQVQLKTWNG